jgi:hypothetical protein
LRHTCRIRDLSLDGFETARVARQDAARIVLSIAHAVETTTVVAP